MQGVSHSFSEKIVIGCQMTFTKLEKISYGTTLAATILGGAGMMAVMASSTLAITLGGVLGGSVGLIGIIFHRTLIAGDAEQELGEIKKAKERKLSNLFNQTKVLADKGYRDALFYLGYLGYKFDTPREFEIFNHFKQAADMGHITAQNEIGGMYRYGQGVKADMSLALKYYKQAADQGDSMAMRMIGNIYRDRENYQEALKWYQLAAKNNVGAASLDLAHVYYQGEWGENVNYQKAAEYYEKAYEQSTLSQDLFLRLIEIYQEGLGGVEKNFEKVKKYDKLYQEHFSKKIARAES